MLVAIRRQLKICRESLSRIGNGFVSSNLEVGPLTKKFLQELEKLIAILPNSEHELVTAVKYQIHVVKSNILIHPFAFGQLQAFLNCLSIRYNGFCAKPIFISHSSRDKEIIEIFVEKILRLGVGISIDNICCTSIETMGIKNGDDMRAHILNNILGCDLALLMISPSYIQSPICLNEMGAVWSTSIPDVNIFVFPDGELPKSIGWLYEVKQADLLFSKVALDKFYDKVTVMYNLERNVAEWGRQRDGFLLAYNKIQTEFEWVS